MSQIERRSGGIAQAPHGDNLADVLERVLDKGIVIAGDIAVNLLDIELLTIKLRLLVASVDKAQEIGINWWTADPYLSREAEQLQTENRMLREQLDRLETTVRSLSEGHNGGQPVGREQRDERSRPPAE